MTYTINDLIKAIINNDIQHLKAIIDSGNDINVNAKLEAQDSRSRLYKTTPLILACENNCYAAAKLLLEHGADVNSMDDNGKFPLILVVDNTLKTVRHDGDISFLELICQYNPNIEMRDGKYKETALEHAFINEQNNKVFEFLLYSGADINATRYDQTMLMFEASGGFKDGVERLIKYGSDVNIEVNDETALTVAVKNNKRGIFNTLIKAGANADFKHQDGRNILFDAILTGNHRMLDLCERVSSYDIYALDNDGFSLLTMAAWANQAKLVRYLFEKGLDVSHKTNSGLNALEIAILNKSLHSANELFNIGLTCDKSFLQGKTVEQFQFLSAMENKDYQTIDKLLSNKFNPNFFDKEYKSPMSYAIKKMMQSWLI